MFEFLRRRKTIVEHEISRLIRTYPNYAAVSPSDYILFNPNELMLELLEAHPWPRGQSIDEYSKNCIWPFLCHRGFTAKPAPMLETMIEMPGVYRDAASEIVERYSVWLLSGYHGNQDEESCISTIAAIIRKHDERR